MGELVALDPQRTTVQVAESGVATVAVEGGAATITAPEPAKGSFSAQIGVFQGGGMSTGIVRSEAVSKPIRLESGGEAAPKRSHA